LAALNHYPWKEKEMTNRLYRSRKDRLIGGVCGGLGTYFGIDPVIVRLLFVVVAVWGGLGFLGYLILWIIIPPEERLGETSQDVIQGNVSEIEERAQGFAQDAREAFSGRATIPAERTMWAAVALIALGVVLLFSNIFGFSFDKLWPVLLVLAGVFMIYQAIQRR
jgi:phage shock protein PspC (stress-responsive transcriptional regulator)